MGDIKDYQKKRIKEYDKEELLNSRLETIPLLSLVTVS
jgi:hypothetical protein